MDDPQITVYGAHWCPDCRRSKQFLGEHQMPYRWVDIEKDEDAEHHVMELNNGKRIIPTIVFGDGSILVEPSNAELAQKLGLRTIAERTHYDLIIIGGGPAGLTAALYAGREGIEALLIERGALGGQVTTTQQLDNVPGFVGGISGPDYARGLEQQAERFGAELLEAQQVVRIRVHDHYRCVCTADGSEYSAEAILIASGSRYRRLGVPGEDDYIGAGIHFCATCDGPFYKGEHVAVVGGGNSAVQESLHLLRYVDKVTLLVRGERLKASEVLTEQIRTHESIDCRFHTVVQAFRGTGGKLDTVVICDTASNHTEEIHPAAAFVFIGLEPHIGFLEGSDIARNEYGFVLTGHDLVHEGQALPAFEGRQPTFLETSVPGIYAAGDVRAGSTKQVAAATGEGATTALLIREYLQSM